jgi:hypothetical protein
MNLDWHTLDRWMIGKAWVGSRADAHLAELCDRIGPRWSSTEAEWEAIRYIRDEMGAAGLHQVALEEFSLDTWAWHEAEARIVEDGRPIDLLPFNRCPPCDLQAPLVDVGYGTEREIDAARASLPGAAAVMALAHEPFTEPIPHAVRLLWLAETGAVAAVAVETKPGRRMEYHSAGDWRDPDPGGQPLPTVVTSREDGALLRKLARAGKALRLRIESEFYSAPSANVVGVLGGTRWPEEHLVLGGHHDTVYGAPGGNDNASGTIVAIETARVLAGLQAEMGVSPGRAIRFVTYSGEEQGFQGAYAYVARHYGPEPHPRLAINLDELSTGRMKGLVLAFPHLRALVQDQFDAMGDGLQCHVMAQLDPTSDHYPFLRAGIDAAFLWRWRFAGRHDDANFHHERGDTADKVKVGELKTYVGQLSRLLLRLSHLPPAMWPESPVTAALVQARLDRERGSVIRVF